MKKLLLPATLLLGSGLAVVGTAHAAIASGTLNVSANITSDCTVSTSPVDFGTVSGATGASATGSIDVTCSVLTPYTIALDGGANFDGTYRRITDGVNFMIYQLSDAATSQLWGDNSILGSTVPGAGTGVAVNYGVSANLWPAVGPSGIYSDIVTVTVTY
ncbi:MAG TPA: spore coat U domain-containing protein [Gammaproteobacteria bacterium]